MKFPTVQLVVGADLPDWAVFWYATPSTLVDFSVAHTYQLKVAPVADLATETFLKTTGFTGAAGDLEDGTPNLSVAFSPTGELNALEGNVRYLAQLTAMRSSDSKQRRKQMYLYAIPAI